MLEECSLRVTFTYIDSTESTTNDCIKIQTIMEATRQRDGQYSWSVQSISPLCTTFFVRQRKSKVLEFVSVEVWANSVESLHYQILRWRSFEGKSALIRKSSFVGMILCCALTSKEGCWVESREASGEVGWIKQELCRPRSWRGFKGRQ